MDNALRDESRALRAMSSAEAADWLMIRYERLPQVLGHRSWKRADQMRLARHYLSGSEREWDRPIYRILLKIMSVARFATVIRERLSHVPPDRLDLVRLQLERELDAAARSERDRGIADDLNREILGLMAGADQTQ